MLIKICKYKFCVNWNQNPKEILVSVQNKIRNNPSFIKQNGIYVIHHLSDLLDSRGWQYALEFINNVSTEDINKWEIWQEFAKVISKNISNANAKDPKQIQTIAKFIFKVRYEPTPKQDNIFIDKVAQQIEKTNEIEQTLRLSAYLLTACPELFEKNKQQMEETIIKKVQICEDAVPDNYKFTILQGIYSNFWTQQFLRKLKQKTNSKNKNWGYFKNLELGDSIIPTQIQKPDGKLIKKTITQAKIGSMLRDLGYVFKQNMLINKAQVDFLFANKIVLSFDGMFHYKINSKGPTPQPTNYQMWKSSALTQRKFTLLRIPFFEWEQLENEKVQKIYLIQKIQKGILKQMKRMQRIVRQYGRV